MNHPRHEILEARTQMAPERVGGLVFVGLLHVAVIYALASGLAVKFIKQIPHEISAEVIPVQEPQNAPPPPPPTKMQVPTLPTVAPPDIEVPQQPAPSPTISVQAQPQPPAAVTQPASTSAAGIASTHTIPPYPEQSRRMGQQGTVTLRVSIGADGVVTDTQIVQSSGVPELDQAALAWVKSHWKYKPAMQNGQPIASTAEAAVVFNLKNAS
jgi:protein TonB